MYIDGYKSSSSPTKVIWESRPWMFGSFNEFGDRSDNNSWYYARVGEAKKMGKVFVQLNYASTLFFQKLRVLLLVLLWVHKQTFEINKF